MMADHDENPGNEDVDVLDPSVIDRVPWTSSTAPRVRHVGEEFVTGCPFEQGAEFPGLGVDVGELTVVYKPRDYLLETNTYQEYLNQFKDARLGHEGIVDHIWNATARVLFPVEDDTRIEAFELAAAHQNMFLQLTYPVTTSGMRRDVSLGNPDLMDQFGDRNEQP